MLGKSLLSISDLSRDEVRLLISDAISLKAKGWLSILDKRVIALVFEKPSLRTRVSFEVAMCQLGGQSLYLSPAEVGLGQREPAADVARVLSRFVDAIVARTFSHETLETLASYSRVPVINALSDLEHPCQALADLLTIHEKKGNLENVTLAYIGDGNNVAHSLMLAASLAGMDFRIASPSGYTVNEKILQTAQTNASENGCEIVCTEDPQAAVKDVDVIYTDVWTSMGQEAEATERRQVFANYKITAKLLSAAKEDAIIMHPLPAHYGEEVEPGILDCPQSVVFDQAENRLHAQKALLAHLLGGMGIPHAYYR